MNKIFSLDQRIRAYPRFTEKEREHLERVLSALPGGVDPELKLKVYKTVLELQTHARKPFGMIVAIGWRRKWDRDHAAVADADQNLFKARHFNVRDHSFKACAESLKRTTDFDGAILISREGIVFGSGVYLENMKPKKVAQEMRGGNVEDLSVAFGFEKKVHTRHLAGIAASYILKGTTIITVSEEDRSVRMFECGRIAWSTVAKEVKNILDKFEEHSV